MNKKVLIITAAFFYLLLMPAVAFSSPDSSEQSMTSQMTLMMVQVGVILFVAWLGGAVFRRLGLPEVLGEVISGTIVGPYFLGSIPLPWFEYGLFPLGVDFPVSAELYAFATMASIVLLFLVGIETDINTFVKYSLPGAAVGLGGVVFSFVFGDLIGVIFSKYLFQTQYGFMDPVPLFLGAICIATSVGISARILLDKKKLTSPEGVTILSGAVIDDVFGIIILAIIVSMAKSARIQWSHVAGIGLKAIAIWVGCTALGLLFARQLAGFLKLFKEKNSIAVMGLALALIISGLFEKSGLALIIGAYVIGLSLSKTDLSFLMQENLSVLRRFFVPVFFCVMGMLVNIGSARSLPIIIVGSIFSVAAIASKILGCGLPALLFNFNLRGAARIGVGMIPRGEVALIIAGIGLASGVLHENAFTISIMMTFVTTMVTPPFMAKMLSSDKPVLRKMTKTKEESEEIVYYMPNPETAELMLGKIIGAFENEGFYVYHIQASERFYQIRKDQTFITMKYTAREIVFTCSEENHSFIHTLFYEVIAEAERVMKNLEMLTDKEAVGKSIFDEKSAANGNIILLNIINPLAVEVDLKGRTKLEIIEELTGILVRSGQLKSEKRDDALRDILNRESSMSTGMQDGIALPHCKSSIVSKLICAVGIKKSGIDYESLDKKPSKIFVMVMAPHKSAEAYLQFMAEVSKVLARQGNNAKIISCRTNEQLYNILTKVPGSA